MNWKKLNAIRDEMESMRRSPQRSSDLESLARQLGRQTVNRGKHPTWVNPNFPNLRPLSIPSHPGDMAKGTANSILNQLEDDLNEWDEQLSNEDANSN